jgi:Domain of unknown function (DUF4394)
MISEGTGMHPVRRAVVAGLIALVLGGNDALAARNCVSNTGKGRSARVKSLKVVGLTSDGRLLCFPAKSADKAEVVGSVTGLGSADSALIGIDFRAQDGKLYGVGNGGGVYTIDPTTATATFVNRLTVMLDPTALFFGVDFNPAADRLRIVSDTGQNLRHNVNAGGTTLSDAPLTIMVGTGVVTAPGITGAAYTNNDVPPPGMPTGTTLYDLDTMRNQVVVQSPPNGVPMAIAPNLVPTGNLGLDPDPAAGFDIYSVVVGGTAVDNLGYAVLNRGASSGFYSVSFQTGQATLLDEFKDQVVDIALPLNQN